MNDLEKAFGTIDAQLQGHLDTLNAALTAFKNAEAETPVAEEREDSDRLIRLWNIKNQAVQSYMQEWDFLIRYGQIFFDDKAKKLNFVPMDKTNQRPEADIE